MKKEISVLILISGIVLVTRFFCGVYEHDEFAETNVFIKHRPTWKWRFYSPIGMSDLKIEELSKEKQIEQQYFNEFITDQGLSR